MGEKVVLVLGLAAAGKTTFINLATGRGDSGVGHGIDRGTTEVEWVRPPHLIHGRNIIFIDTPGLDDPERQDTEIVTMITDSLTKSNVRLDTILYLHPISDNRIPHSGSERLKLLTRLSKIDSISNMIIATTMWDEVVEEVGAKREEQLKSKFWADLIAKGCHIKRFHRTAESALEVLQPFAKKVVLVLGPACAGKTTFINFATRRGDYGIGHDIEPGTTSVEWIEPSHPIEGHEVIFVDTPGFDDATKPDRETMMMIKDSVDKAKRKPDIILYLHPISFNRIAGSEVARLNLFMNSWDIGKVPNIVIVTTMWDEVKHEIGTKREEQLKSKFWAELIANGCEVKQFSHTNESALDILRPSLARIGSFHHVTDGSSGASKRETKNLPKELTLLQRLLRELFSLFLNSQRMESRNAASTR